MKKCVRCDGDHVKNCSGKSNSSCSICDAQLYIRDNKGYILPDGSPGVVICANGHIWGECPAGENKQEKWWNNQVEYYKPTVCGKQKKVGKLL